MSRLLVKTKRPEYGWVDIPTSLGVQVLLRVGGRAGKDDDRFVCEDGNSRLHVREPGMRVPEVIPF